MGKKKEQKLPTQTREPSAEYVRAKDIPAFFGQPMLKGTYAQINSDRLNPQVPALYLLASTRRNLDWRLDRLAPFSAETNRLILYLPIRPTTSRKPNGIPSSLSKNTSTGRSNGSNRQRAFSSRPARSISAAFLKFWPISSFQRCGSFKVADGWSGIIRTRPTWALTGGALARKHPAL